MNNRQIVTKALSSGGVAVLTLDHPARYNALSKDMIAALTAALEEVSANKDVRVIVLKGAGKGFCAGHDLAEISENRDEAFYRALVGSCCGLMQLIQSVPQPVIAQVHGAATAAGCQLVAACDLAYASDDARFSTPGVLIGLFCTTPMVALSRSIHRKQALEMLLTGDFITAARAAAIGLINASVPVAALDQAVMDSAAKIAAKPPSIIGMGKKAFYQQAEMATGEAYRFAMDLMVENLLAPVAHDGIATFLARKKSA